MKEFFIANAPIFAGLGFLMLFGGVGLWAYLAKNNKLTKSGRPLTFGKKSSNANKGSKF